jgi:hypothetical protein
MSASHLALTCDDDCDAANSAIRSMQFMPAELAFLILLTKM